MGMGIVFWIGMVVIVLAVGWYLMEYVGKRKGK